MALELLSEMVLLMLKRAQVARAYGSIEVLPDTTCHKHLKTLKQFRDSGADILAQSSQQAGACEPCAVIQAILR
jgi:hypothetical protein